MRAIGVNPGLTHRLLVTIARLHTAGQDQCDWPAIAAATGGAVNTAVVQRALAGLAEDGLVEGVYTASGWLRLSITSQGLRRAGRAGRQPLPDVRYWHTDTEPDPLVTAAESPSPESPPPIELDAEQPDAEPADPPPPRQNPLEPAALALRDGWRRATQALAPRVTAVRTQVAQVWRLLTTFP